MDRHPNIQTLLLFLLFTLSGCKGPSAQPAGIARTDSAGIDIVDHTLEFVLDLPLLNLGPAPILDIGTVDGPEEYQLFRVSGGTVLPGDTVLVVNGGSQELRFFDPNGQFIRKVGREGEGPGEFRFPYWVWHVADSIAVWDGRLNRLAFFDQSGTFLRQAIPERQGMNSRLLGVFSDGSFLVQDSWFAGIDDSMNPMTLRFAVFDHDGRFVDSLPEHPYGLMGRLGESQLVGGPLFGMRTSTAADSKSFWVGTGLEPEVRRFDPNGDLFQWVRWADQDRAVSSDELEQYWAKMFERTPEGRRGQIEELKRSMPVADQFPVFQHLQSTTEGGLWVQLFRRPSDHGPDRWLVVNSGGELVGRVETPEGFLVLEIGEDYVAGVRMDELDVQHFTVYRIGRDGP